MKTLASTHPLIMTLLATLLVFGEASSLFAGPRSELWKQVDEAVEKSLPKTAIEKLNHIIPAAVKDKAYGEGCKAIARKLILEGKIQGNEAEKIRRIDGEIAKASDEMLPLLQTIKAAWLWGYYKQDLYQFRERTEAAQVQEADFTTWDERRLFAEIDILYQKALSPAASLKKMSVATFDDLLQKGTLPDTYRPTLYDFLAQEAIKFYSQIYKYSYLKVLEDCELTSEGIIFGDAEEFMQWHTTTPLMDCLDSPFIKVLDLYGHLLKFHEKDQDLTAFLDIELARLVFGYDSTSGKEKNAQYKIALKEFVKKWADHEISALALYHLSLAEDDLAEAHRIASRGRNAYPDSVGGRMCHKRIQEIEAKSFSINTERVWTLPMPEIVMTYTNIAQIHFRAVPYDWHAFTEKRLTYPLFKNEDERSELLMRSPALQWSANLPPTPDFKRRKERLPAPAALKPGFYLLLASDDPDFRDTDNQIRYIDIWVSDLALVVLHGNGKVEGFVTNACSGEPISGAEVTTWYRDKDGKLHSNGEALRTDANGFFSDTPKEDRPLLLHARAGGHELASDWGYFPGRPSKRESRGSMYLFTDRALYRPGQTVSYKGIVARADEGNSQVIPDRKVEVIWADPNGRQIAKHIHTTNDYGSLSGKFALPHDCETGRFEISFSIAGDKPAKMMPFSVEEYKRPRFRVTLDPPRTAVRLSEMVSLQGKAVSYTGAPVDSAKVKWRVERQAHGYQYSRTKIEDGTTVTGTDGAFKIQFNAVAPAELKEKNEAAFRFTIYADVTDSAGETRSAQRSAQIGFATLSARVEADAWQTDDKAVEFKIRTTSLDGDAQTAHGLLKVYRLVEPVKVRRVEGKRWWNAPWHLSDLEDWPLGELVLQKDWSTDAEGKTTVPENLGLGAYRAELLTRDRFGRKATSHCQIIVLRPRATRLDIKIPSFVIAPRWEVEPGQEFTALWGTGYEQGRACIEVEHRGRILRRYWTRPGETQHWIRQTVSESMRGGFTIHVTQVRENRLYRSSHNVIVPWSNKDLELKWEHFTSKLQPNQEETWTAVITRRDDSKVPHAESSTTQYASAPEPAIAEMVATLYDEALDAYKKHYWPQKFGFFRQDDPRHRSDFENRWNHDGTILEVSRETDSFTSTECYREFRNDVIPREDAGPRAFIQMSTGTVNEKQEEPAGDRDLDLSQVIARRNLSETAFFFPHLMSDSNGVVRMTFTMPEALTQWRFLGFAHDRECRSGLLRGSALTAKDLMVQPNPPRFVREGDELEFTVKVLNQSAERTQGKVRLTFNEVLNDQSADTLLGNTSTDLDFDIPAKESRSFSWPIHVPDDCGFLSYKAVATSGKLSDGEEGCLPVLSRRTFITESLPLQIRGPSAKTCVFPSLLQSGKSTTLAHKGLSVQMVSNPSWYAVMALPYLMEFPHECAEQTFNRLFANALARSIAKKAPKVRHMFDQWKGTPTLDSPLDKNQDLKSLMIEETPWYRQAQDETQSRKSFAVLFDDRRLDAEIERTLRKLRESQLDDGTWPWFPGGRSDEYITLYIMTGFGRLNRLGVDIDMKTLAKSVNRLDESIRAHYRKVQAHPSPQDYVLSPNDALYLYGRTFFLKDKPVGPKNKMAVEFFLDQGRKFWSKMNNRQSQGHIAIALNRWGGDENLAEARNIMKSIKARSLAEEEMGMFWREPELSWWWYRAPIETQALMMEAFDEVMGDDQSVEECRIWLLRQKQTQGWKSTKATADAIYALLLRGKDPLESDKLVEISLGGMIIEPHPAREDTAQSVEGGTGFFEKRIPAGDIRPELGEIMLRKMDEGLAWGSVNWQYIEDISKVLPSEGTPLRLKKSLYTKTYTERGPVLVPLKGPLTVGDELVVCIELQVDRDMEYIHLKDQRGSGTEPLNVLSGYRYQEGLNYYESTRDAASHFFIDRLPKGTYMLDYSMRIQHRGQYQSGVAEVQCMYAPEFNSHSESFALTVK